MNKLFRKVILGLGVVGSSFIKRTVDGKYEVAMAPIVLAAVIGSGAACAAQTEEPFRVCLKTTLDMIKEVIYAS